MVFVRSSLPVFAMACELATTFLLSHRIVFLRKQLCRTAVYYGRRLQKIPHLSLDFGDMCTYLVSSLHLSNFVNVCEVRGSLYHLIFFSMFYLPTF